MPAHPAWQVRRWPECPGGHAQVLPLLSAHGTGRPQAPPDDGWLAMRGGVLLGFVRLVEEDDPLQPGTLPCLADLCVAADARNQGIGAALCEAVRSQARAAALPRLWLFTRDRAGYFQRLGWQPAGHCAIRIGPAIDWVTVMACQP